MSIRIPRLVSTIDQRLLINYRVDPAVAQTLIPEGMRPRLVDGSAVAGICQISQRHLRPRWLRPRVGVATQGSAHRIAVEWDDATGTHSGVFIAKRHSASRLAQLLGGRVFPGIQLPAAFDGDASDDLIRVSIDGDDVHVRAEVAVRSELRSSLFGDDLHAASEFFRDGGVGWSPARDGGLEGLSIESDQWRVDPGEVLTIESSYFDALPGGSATLDSVLVMRNVPMNWSAPSELEPRVFATSA